MRIFISGPMTGIEGYNFQTFDFFEKMIVESGNEAVNPAKISRQYKASDIETDRSVYDQMVEKQIENERKCDAILLLDGWENSKGVRRELELALISNMRIFLQKSFVEFIREENKKRLRDTFYDAVENNTVKPICAAKETKCPKKVGVGCIECPECVFVPVGMRDEQKYDCRICNSDEDYKINEKISREMEDVRNDFKWKMSGTKGRLCQGTTPIRFNV